jgi:hypothetical protein
LLGRRREDNNRVVRRGRKRERNECTVWGLSRAWKVTFAGRWQWHNKYTSVASIQKRT